MLLSYTINPFGFGILKNIIVKISKQTVYLVIGLSPWAIVMSLFPSLSTPTVVLTLSGSAKFDLAMVDEVSTPFLS